MGWSPFVNINLYHQERSFDILDGVTSRYQVDGFFVNRANFNE